MVKLSRSQRKKQNIPRRKPKKVSIVPLGYKQEKQYRLAHPTPSTPKESDAERRKRQAQERFQKKINAIRDAGIDPFKFKKKDINSIKIKDIDAGLFDTEHYPLFFGGWTIPRELKKCFVLAYMDYAGNNDFSELYSMIVNNKTVEELLAIIKEWRDKPCTYVKRLKSDSSGSAGDAMMHYGSEQACNDWIEERNQDTFNMKFKPRRAPWKLHPQGYNIGWQCITDENGKAITKLSPKGALAICAGVLPNIQERQRLPFYKDWLYMIEKNFPEIIERL